MDESVSSQYGRKPNTSRLSPPGSTAAARSAIGADAGSTYGRSMAARAGPPPNPVAAAAGGSLRTGGPGSLADRSALPLTRPAGSSLGRTPPTAHRSAARGLNGTLTRSPGANAVLSPAWATASSYWTVGWSVAGGPAAFASPAVASEAATGAGGMTGARPDSTSIAAATATSDGPVATWRRACGRRTIIGEAHLADGLRHPSLVPTDALRYGSMVPVWGSTV